ncbi:MAG: HAMP domain-containing sensor histidine kinase [Deltaproteobacteria bacterium]|nr:HAMP domain-containing sensor histidine kinase [Deltaproteobacteria bacterium]
MPVDRTGIRGYPWWGLLVGASLGIFLGHPLSMVAMNLHRYISDQAPLRIGQAILDSFHQRMWPMIFFYAASGGMFGAVIGFILQKLRERQQRLDVFHEEFELQVATLRHHYKNLALGIHGFSSRIKRKLGDLEQKAGACALQDPIFQEFQQDVQSLVKSLGVLDDAAQRLTHTLGQELLFLRAITSESLQPQTGDFFPLLQHSINDLKAIRFRDKDLAITINGQPYESCQDSLAFAFEPYSMEVILDNILSNAMKFGDRIDIGVEGKGNWIKVKIRDNGPGLEIDELKQYLATPGDRREAESTHLGLKVTLHLLQKIGGQLAVQSQPGAGATFILEIPKTIGP